MPVTPTHAAVVLNGLPDTGKLAAVLVTVRCPHCGDRHVHGLPAPVRSVGTAPLGIGLLSAARPPATGWSIPTAGSA